MIVSFDSLRAANQRRHRAWPGRQRIDIAFRGVELAGEVGELCNVLKKIARIQRGIRGSHGRMRNVEKAALLQELRAAAREEIADVVISLDLIAMDLGVNLSEVVPEKFDETSRKVGIPVLFGDPENRRPAC